MITNSNSLSTLTSEKNDKILDYMSIISKMFNEIELDLIKQKSLENNSICKNFI
jgi:hypothetical protein